MTGVLNIYSIDAIFELEYAHSLNCCTAVKGVNEDMSCSQYRQLQHRLFSLAILGSTLC